MLNMAVCMLRVNSNFCHYKFVTINVLKSSLHSRLCIQLCIRLCIHTAQIGDHEDDVREFDCADQRVPN